jgi:hypothetical protein
MALHYWTLLATTLLQLIAGHDANGHRPPAMSFAAQAEGLVPLKRCPAMLLGADSAGFCQHFKPHHDNSLRSTTLRFPIDPHLPNGCGGQRRNYPMLHFVLAAA